ncbi:hypothetical protein KP79_PYT16601 [Mizuhopecten yessoensis]|uniref:Uncharacterized protein n=1 Tax=Mizuhopecten yessoensis TaxID=6573 RepID=A0A210QL59_MIZYE|nr:hypothetical protein KP79_PYT16601 [Mizuhopecten yessoensis]
MNTRANPNRTNRLLSRPCNRRHSEKRASLLGAERRFRRSCEQIVLLNQRIEELQVRYDKAKQTSNCPFRYNLRLKLAVVEGLRNVYYDYARGKAKMVADLRQELFGEIFRIVADDDDYAASDTSTESND